MLARTIIAVATAVVALSCSTKSSVGYIDYLGLNHDKTNHTDGMTPERLRNLKGHIRSITHYAYLLEEADGNATRRGKLITGTPAYTLQFSEEGLITEEWGYRVEDIVASKTRYRSHRDFQIESVMYWTDQGEMTSQEVYTYDKDGVLVGGYNEYDGQRKDKVINMSKSGDTLVAAQGREKKCYVNGRCVKWEIVEGSTYLHRYSYFPSGALRQEVSLENGTISQDERYDGLGNLVYWLSSRVEDGQVTSGREMTLTYQKDLCVQEITKHVDGPNAWTDTIRYEYREGRPIRSSKNGEPYGIYEYNEHSDLLRRQNDLVNEGYRYTSYDEKGNWTERTMLDHDRPFKVEVRKFEYY